MQSQAEMVASRAFGNDVGNITANQHTKDHKTYYESENGKSAADLMRNYTMAEAFLQHLFAEQRSNLLLVCGNHYTGRGSKFFDKMRQVDNISRHQKLRLTKNHIQRVTKTYINNILNYAPTVGIRPRKAEDLHNQKSAELHQAVWDDIRYRHKFHKLTRQLAKDYVELGEAIVKIGFDEAHGHFLGYDVHVDQDGEPVMEDGEPVYEKAFTGDVYFERILGFNLLSDPDARSWEEVRWVCFRKMVAVDDLRAQFKDDSQIAGQIHESFRQTMKLFDAGTGTYRTGEGLTMVMEHYFRPCADFPNGYYYICLENTILFEGELPLGLFPIVYVGFDEASTSARSFSVIKQLRPYQAEVNRCASKIAEHQITLGDDKLLLLNGASMSPGGTAHGVKAIHVTGTEPKIFAGRTGDQYLAYMQAQISEMYQVSCVEEDSAKKDDGQIDPFAALYKSAKQKKPFVIYIDKFEEFLKEICEIALKLAKTYFTDEMVVRMVGKNEYVNIAEFKTSNDLCYDIIVEATTEDLETRFGKQLALNHFVQYAGNQMEAKDLGLVMRAMPWLNDQELFKDLTIDYDNATNDILAMDRGQFVAPRPSDKHKYLLQRLDQRMSERDFDLLPDQVKQSYMRKRQMHEMAEAQQVQQAQRIQSGFVPSGGFLTTVDMYMSDPEDPTGRRRVRIPSESVEWLVQTLAQQGTTQDELKGLSGATQSDIGRMMPGGPGGTPGPRPGLPGSVPPGGPGVMPLHRPMPQPGPRMAPNPYATPARVA